MTKSIGKIGPFIFFMFLFSDIHAQAIGDVHLLEVIDKLSPIPREISFDNKIEIHNEGGHLQGIQKVTGVDENYYIMSGSSSEYSYLTMVSDEKKNLISMVKLSSRPLKHAGGFQISNNYLAVGIEDNDLRNYSLVNIYDISSPTTFSVDPILSIERRGDFERATAGCVGIARINNRWILIVGDWNTRHLDFYFSNTSNLGEGVILQKELSISDHMRNDWIDTTWLPYQNINLLPQDSSLYLIGMTSVDGENVVDTYRIDNLNSNDLKLVKISHHTLVNTGGDFIWGAGILVEDNHFKGIVSSGRNLREQNKFYIYH